MVVLILDEVGIDKVAQVGAGVPSHIVGINSHLFLHSDHFTLVCGVGFGARCCSSRVKVLLIVLSLGRDIDDWEREAVCDFEYTTIVHANQETCGGLWVSSCAMFD